LPERRRRLYATDWQNCLASSAAFFFAGFDHIDRTAIARVRA
jgi:hypothetical protein